ncbi:Protein PLANT CADMIUM RESISTANCE 3 [Ophiocordyceps camponoti-floridani]|uniref:Protein PLANT CADMIUM RESISTANCE 3 n=1 Tax=Ophiocordyceps camponoti-floridani TaxID=2030778 RepID=A0A8H4QA62_9HYPO|nr:Protein PLANT CADMIUM RESISTANCE 3 [Ophiocordyceps camponoti-floridani]
MENPPLDNGHLPPTPPQQQQPHDDEWGNHLCDCSPCESCLLATFLPCMLSGRTATRMRDPSMQSFREINDECVIYGLVHGFTGFGWVLSMIRRGEIRRRYGIKGNCCGDYCVSYWCLCCDIIQQDKEVRRRTAGIVTSGYDGHKERMYVPGAAPPPPHGYPPQQQSMMVPQQDEGTVYATGPQQQQQQHQPSTKETQG